MGSKVVVAIVIVILLLAGIFLIAPSAFDGIVPDEYIPNDNSEVLETEIHWQNRD